MASDNQREIAERALNGIAIVWLLVVGLTTHTIAHHVIHAIPLVVVAILPRGRRTWLMRAMSAYLWLFMLALMSPMIEEEILHGQLLRGGGEIQHWLAPMMALIACAWFAACVSLLTRARFAFLAAFVLIAAFTAALASAQTYLGPTMTTPVDELIAGNLNALAVVGLELVLALAAPWAILLRVAKLRPSFGVREVTIQVAYWGAFVLCMLGGLLVD